MLFILEESLKQLPGVGGETIQGEWDIWKGTIQEVAEEVLGRRVPREREEWFDKACERVTKGKNEAYLIMGQQHGTWNKVIRYQEKRSEEKKIHKKESENGKRNS